MSVLVYSRIISFVIHNLKTIKHNLTGRVLVRETTLLLVHIYKASTYNSDFQKFENFMRPLLFGITKFVNCS